VRLELDDDFSADALGPVWTAHYLPHWSTPDRSHARYDLDGSLRLRIDADQPTWTADEPIRVSSIQTADFSGPAGSTRGIHPHRAGLRVVSPASLRLGWAPVAGRVEVTVAASTDPGCMTAAWLVGTEHLSGDGGASGELCLFELDAETIGPERSRARTGIKAHRDPRLVTELGAVDLPFDASRPHTWSVEWGHGVTVISCEGVELRRLAQAPEYPLVLLVDLFETSHAGEGRYPKTARILRVRGWAAD